MGIRAIKPIFKETYTPDGQEGDPSDDTSFDIRSLNGEQMQDIRCAVEASGQESLKGALSLSGALTLAIRYGLVGWSNFLDENGEPLPFNHENKVRIPQDFRVDLGNRILDISSIDEDEKKS